MTLKPSLERNLVEIIDAMEPNKIEPTIEAKTRNGIVNKLNCTVLKNSGYPIDVIKAALSNPTIAIV